MLILTLWPCSAFSPRVESILVFGKDDWEDRGKFRERPEESSSLIVE